MLEQCKQSKLNDLSNIIMVTKKIIMVNKWLMLNPINLHLKMTDTTKSI